MQISSTISDSYSYNGTQNSSSSLDTIKELERQKKEIQADITETSSAQESSDTKEKKLQQLQQQLQQIEMEIQKQRLEQKREETKSQQLIKKQDSLSISDEAQKLYAQLQDVI